MDSPFQKSLFGNSTEKAKKELKKSRFSLKIEKTRFKLAPKAVLDYLEIEKIVAELDFDSVTALFSNQFDSPNIINYFLQKGEIEEMFLGTWAITNSGISCLNEAIKKNPNLKVKVVMDKLHSAKWVFASGAIDILKGKVEFIFCENHAKFICLKTNDAYYSFVGSMNLSNNPRWENIFVEKSESENGLYSFCKEFTNQLDNEI
jgi:hypothetical protein